ncbi:MAG: hypothetical protein VXX28_08280, partial [Verrucomicrobiota bacterium]|nr:hypothetical protein [Verrucomicrobiota bacterium]
AQASPHLESLWLGLSVRMTMKYSRLSNYRQVIEEHNNVIHAVMEKDVEKALFYLEENVI